MRENRASGASSVILGRCTATLALVLAAGSAAAPAAVSGRPERAPRRWIGVWEAPPSDASGGPGTALPTDASGNPRMPVQNETIRAVLTPSYGGTVLRIRLTNRFALTPAVFGAVTIAAKGTGASLGSQVRAITFRSRPDLTLAPGKDVVSDPVRFTFRAMQRLAVSIYVANDPGNPSEHFTARQTSYLTAPGSGNHTADPSGLLFTSSTTARPYLEGLDVQAPRSSAAVLALGDSITDGYQGGPAGVPEVTPTVDTDGRWPDDLARRLIAARIPLSVMNAGITGNKVLADASGTGLDSAGPAALHRLAPDVLDQAGVTTVIWLEGINDIAANGPTAAEIETGLSSGIRTLHRRGLRVLLGTLTPTGSAQGAFSGFSSAAVEAEREQVNAWIRHRSPADGVIDFDRAVRDPAVPSQIKPNYNGGDGLHMSLAGYQAMANAVQLSELRPRKDRPWR